MEAAWLALARRRVTAVRPVSRWEAMRRAWVGWRLWGAKRKQAEPSNSQAVRVQRQRERARWLRQWLQWEAGLQARHQARAARAGEEPSIPPPPPEGTPERRAWEERYAHLLHPPRPSQQKEVEEQDTGSPREGMSLAEWKQYDNEPLARYERQQANQAYLATPARLEARGGYTRNDPIRQRQAAQREGPPSSSPSPSPFSPFQRLWNAITHPVETFQNTLIALGRRFPLARKAIVAVAEAVHTVNRTLSSIPDDPPWPWWVSLIPLVGDGLDLAYEGLKKLVGKPVDELNVVLSVAGLILDGPEDAGIAGDAAIALLKKGIRALGFWEQRALRKLVKELGDEAIPGLGKVVLQGGEEGLQMVARLARKDREAAKRLVKALLHGDEEATWLLRQGDLEALLKRYSTRWNAEQLLRAMLETGQKIPPGWHVHHIVPSTSNKDLAREARKILEYWGIDINDAVNGVALPPDVHARIHTQAYLVALLERLEKAGSREKVIEILKDVSQTLQQKGIYP